MASSTTQPSDGSQVVFSIRPSALSPLHSLYREGREVAARARFMELTLQAQQKLGEQLSTPAEESLAAQRAKLSRQADTYGRLLRAGALPGCSSPEHMAGYFALLEQQLQDVDDDFIALRRVLSGEHSVWNYWFSDFAAHYQGLPSLPPLEQLFNAPSPLQGLRQELQVRQASASEPAPRAAGGRSPGGTQAAAPAAHASEPGVAATGKARERRRRGPKPLAKWDQLGRIMALGARKTSTAQVYLWPADTPVDGATGGAEGGGAAGPRILINRRPLDDYFQDPGLRAALLRPLLMTGLAGRVNVLVQVNGGGLSGQAQAAAHGIARALQTSNPAALHAPLAAAGLLARDPRMVERKKPGKAKARKSFTWVKR